MKRISQFCQTKSLRDGDSSNRKGSILVVVIALLGMLLLLGIAFFTFASQEQASAEFYSDSTKFKEPGFSVETLFNFGMEQLITGPIPELKQSALWSRRYSMMANMLGTRATTVDNGFFDTVPFNGQGIHLINDGNVVAIDQDYSGITDDGTGIPAEPNNLFLLNLNLSAPANGGAPVDPTSLPFPQPDVDYTYPDVNNLFLAHINDLSQGVNSSPHRRLIIPSFFRP
ncbi:MAG: hypothetical protein KDA68_05915, partial [Planctomycetaceae bacterium]|nr:hypothetical protein [Planctomycetaceae bacterium]